MPLYKQPKSENWYVRIGRKTRQSTGTTDRAKAEEFERVLQERIWRREKLGDRGAVSWKEASHRWLKDSTRPRKRDRWILQWLEPKLANEAVSDVADPDALEMLRAHGAAAGWSHSSIDRMMATVSSVLHACVGWRYLDSAPVVPMYRPPVDEPRWLTPAEVDRLCWHSMMHQALAIRVAVHTMLRMRAMLNLTKARVNLEERRAWIPGAHQKAARTFGLPLNAEATRALRALWMLSPPDSPYIFTWQGKPIDDCNTVAFQEAVKRAGVGPLRWHDLRHTGASWAVQSGVTLQELMVLGDWRDYRSVLRYAHLAPSQAASAAEKVAEWAHTARETERRPQRRRMA
jgi:integrase